MNGPDIVRTIQEKRPGALTNNTFREYLLSLNVHVQGDPAELQLIAS